MSYYNYGYGYQPMQQVYQYPAQNVNYQNYVPNQQQINQFNQSQTVQSQNNFVSCEYVDGIDIVNTRNSDLSGKPIWYIKTDNTEIYKKLMNFLI